MKTCSTCGCGDPFALVDGVRNHVCVECGTAWNEYGWKLVPRRSQPAEVLERPDATGDWWVWYGGPQKWKMKLCSALTNWGPGRYIRAVPPGKPGGPIVPPNPQDADVSVECLRQLVEKANLLIVDLEKLISEKEE